jgi:hypothetical protein
MADPLTLSAVGAVVLTEGIKFLYGQAGELLKRRRERKEKGAAAVPEQVAIPPTTALNGQLGSPAVDDEYLDKVEGELRELKATLNDYADGTEIADPGNHDLLVRVDELRQLIEAIYGQRITFDGEARPPSGTPVVIGNLKANIVRGKAGAVNIDKMNSGNVTGTADVGEVEKEGQVNGVKIRRLG